MNPPTPPPQGQIGNTALITVKVSHIKNQSIYLRAIWLKIYKELFGVKYVHLASW